MTGEIQIHATYTESRVNCGGNFRDISRAIAITSDMTIDEVLTAGLAYRISHLSGTEVVVNPEDYITIRVAKVGEHEAQP